MSAFVGSPLGHPYQPQRSGQVLQWLHQEIRKAATNQQINQSTNLCEGCAKGITLCSCSLLVQCASETVTIPGRLKANLSI